MSTVPAVRAALVALGTSTLGFTAGYGSRVTISPGERLVVGDAKGTSEPTGLAPTRPMEENYEVTCRLSVTQNGTVDIQQQVTERAWALHALYEVAIRTVPGMNLGVAGVSWAYVAGEWEETQAPASDTGGPVNTSIEFHVRVRASYRLTLP
jgi:hypothetical protein